MRAPLRPGGCGRRRAAGTTAVLALAIGAADAGAHPVPRGARGGEPVVTPASTAQTIALRQRYFGAANVDARTGAVRRDRVILSWFGVTNFAMAIRGHVVLLDAWVPRGGSTGYVPSSPAELAALRPEAILIGHAHFDHAADAVPIALASGATLVGTAEHCTELLSRVPAGAMPPRCVGGVPAGSDPGTTRTLDVLRGVGITMVKSLHSAGKTPDLDDGLHVPVLPPPATTQLEHPPTPQDLVQLVGGLPDAEGGSALYRFSVGDLQMVWNDTAGPLKEEAPFALEQLRRLRPVDVQVGAIQGFGQFTNGMRDMRQYVEAIGAPLFVPGHHDDWAAGITTKGENYREPLRQELARIPAERRPQVRFISDPGDYVRPEALTFPVALEPLKLTRRCVGAGRLRVRLTGDAADVRSVRFVLGRYRTGAVASAPLTRTLPRSAVERRGRARLQARVTDVDGSVRTIARSAPACGT